MVALDLGFVQIYWYGIMYAIAFIVSYIYIRYVVEKKVFITYPRVDTFLLHDLDDLMLFAVGGILIGGRLGHVFIYDFAYFIEKPLHIFALQQGGMSFIGGMIGVTVAVLFLKWYKKLSWKDWRIILDMILTIVPFGIMIGRIGNFLNQELYGIAVPTHARGLSARWIDILHRIGIFYVYPAVDGLVRVNTNILASFGEGFLLLICMQWIWWSRISHKLLVPGYMTGCFLLGYSMIRFVLEYIRQDAQMEFVGWLTRSQWFFVGFFFIGIWLVYNRCKRV